MAICPDHGAYEGTCKKCSAIANSITASDPLVVPKIEDGDKFILRSLEVDALNAQLKMRDAQQEAQSAAQALNRFASTIFEKLKLDPKDWILDAKSMTLVKRATDEDSSGHKQ